MKTIDSIPVFKLKLQLLKKSALSGKGGGGDCYVSISFGHINVRGEGKGNVTQVITVIHINPESLAQVCTTGIKLASISPSSSYCSQYVKP